MAAGDGYVFFLLIRCVGEAGRAKAFMDGWFRVARGWISMYVRTYLSRYMYIHTFPVPDAGTGSAFGRSVRVMHISIVPKIPESITPKGRRIAHLHYIHSMSCALACL
jgi:hypothetical protein